MPMQHHLTGSAHHLMSLQVALYACQVSGVEFGVRSLPKSPNISILACVKHDPLLTIGTRGGMVQGVKASNVDIGDVYGRISVSRAWLYCHICDPADMAWVQRGRRSANVEHRHV
jgi:hypothetical protein